MSHFLVRQSQMYAVWWAQISAFVGSMTKKWPCPSGGWGQNCPSLCCYWLIWVTKLHQ